MSRCHNAVPRDQVKRRFESLASREYVGQQQAWNNVRVALESYTGLSPRATCGDWVLHFTGPSGSGKSFLAEIIANSAFYPWELEAYSFAQLGIASAACLAVGALSWALGPVGMGVGCTAGAVGANAVWNNAQISSTFQVPQPFPSQCGVLQYKFSRSSGVDDVRLWEYRVAQELLRDPAAVIIVDDVGRLRDVTAFEHFGRLLCGVGGNSIPEFRKGPGDSVLVPASQALFVLTSDLELEQADNHISCEVSFLRAPAVLHHTSLMSVHSVWCRWALSIICSNLCESRVSAFGKVDTCSYPTGGIDCRWFLSASSVWRNFHRREVAISTDKHSIGLSIALACRPSKST